MSITNNVAAESTPLSMIPVWLRWNFALTILISAFLLFQVQPLISKFILPWFGGSPAVWTTCMLFFQVLLFGGYAYAHATVRFLSPRGQGLLHMGLLLLACAFLPIVPNPVWKPVGSEHPTLRILALLGLTVGLPYFVLSSTGPLVQAWFSRANPGKSPYRLYALSNFGSLAALITYPFYFEPKLASGLQAWTWSGAFLCFGAMCGSIAWFISRPAHDAAGELASGSLPPDTAEATAGGLLVEPSEADGAPTVLQRVAWVALPAIASLVLLATTNHVCQDVASIPLLWVIPLSLYLLTFIISFDHERWYLPGVFGVLAGLLLFFVGGLKDLPIPEWVSAYITFKIELGLYFAAMFLACMICHGQLVRLRPRPRYLTEYYMMISAGGALGGIFVSLIAPHIFKTFVEFRIGLVLAYSLAIGVIGWRLCGLLKELREAQLAVGFCAGVLALAGSGVLIGWEFQRDEPLYRARNFYGVVSVRDYDTKRPDYHYRIFVSGRIQHGVQYMEGEKRRKAISYFGETSGVGRALTYASQNTDARVGVVGLGIGASAVYAKPGHYYRFYEINPEVEKIAREYFYYLADCQGKHDVVLGDARLTLEREEPQRFDVICLDAFSGDAVPTHLLTKEAFEVYLKHLKKRDTDGRDGILVVNITNTYVNLAPVVEMLADHHKLGWTRIMKSKDADKDLYTTDYMLLTRDEKFLAENPPEPEDIGKRKGDGRPMRLWTDDYTNMMQIME